MCYRHDGRTRQSRRAATGEDHSDDEGARATACRVKDESSCSSRLNASGRIESTSTDAHEARSSSRAFYFFRRNLMVTTIQASKNVDRQLREERRERIAVEQRKLDTAREAEANTKRVARLEVEKAQRVAAAVKVGSTAEFTVPDDTMVYRIRVTMTHEDVTARQAARTLVIALA